MRGSGEMMNNSLSDLLQIMELSPSSSKSKASDAASIGTKDSLRRANNTHGGTGTEKLSKRGAKKSMLTVTSVPVDGSFSESSMNDLLGASASFHELTSMDLDTGTTPTTDPTFSAKVKEGSTPKRSKRGGRKSDDKSDLERSLSGLGFDDSHDPSMKRGPKDCPTVATIDSIDKEKSSSTRVSKRGGKKSNGSGGKPDLERSLSGLDFDDDHVCNLKHISSSNIDNNDCHTVSTMDSINREKMSSTKPSKRGGRKVSVQQGGKLDLEKSLSELDYNDDALLYSNSSSSKLEHDSHTVSTMDSLQREKSMGKPSKRGGKKNDVIMSSQSPYEKGKPVSLTSSLSKLGGPPRDFGRHADDNDTFCDVGDNDKHATTSLGIAIGNKLIAQPHNQAFMKSNPFARKDDSDDDSDDEEEDLFQTSFPGKNPFRLPTHR